VTVDTSVCVKCRHALYQSSINPVIIVTLSRDNIIIFEPSVCFKLTLPRKFLYRILSNLFSYPIRFFNDAVRNSEIGWGGRVISE
jgi:hypothetical protein